jgi:D-alanyl-D-alanine carboxypeptidase
MTTPTTGQLGAVHAFLDRHIANGRSPGAQYLFLAGDAVLAEYNGGMANPAARTPVSGRTTFNAFSATKTFTAAAILKLAEQGRLDLDAPMAQYLEALPYAEAPTVRQTLTHTGGFANPNPLRWVHLAEEHDAFDDAGFVREVMRAHARLKSPPGRSVAYSNVGYLLLGEVIERVSGQPYVEFVERHVIQPLRLRDGETLAFDIPWPDEHARGTLRRWGLLNLLFGLFLDRDRYIDARSGPWLQLRNLLLNGAAYGGLIGNARGFARYLQAMLGHGEVLSAPYRAWLFTPARGPDGRSLGRSLGWSTGALRGETYFAHAGGAFGYYCETRVYPHIGHASVVMFNRSGVRDERILDRVDGLLLAGSGKAIPVGRQPSGH